MFLITIKFFPKKRTGKLKKVGGAYVCCWIDFKNRWGAEMLAKAAIRANGWVPRKITELKVETLRNTVPQSKRYFREAQKCGYSFVYHWWPIDTPDHKNNYESA